MKKLALCALVLCVFALPGISLGASVVPPVPVVPDLEGTWYLTLTGIAPNATSVTSETKVQLVLNKPLQPGFYIGTITGANTAENGYVTLVQEGAEVRFTISNGSATTAWGGGLAGKNRMYFQWRDNIGVTGIGVGSTVPPPASP